MSTLTLRQAFPTPGASRSMRDVRGQHVRDAMQPRRERTIALTGGAIAVTLFSVLAPIAGNPTERLFALDATPTISTDDAIAGERLFELPPTVMGPAITSEALMLAEEDALYMPPLEIRVTPEGEEVVRPPG